MKLAELVGVVADLVARVTALEAERGQVTGSAPGDLGIVRSMIEGLQDADDMEPGDGTVLYVGAGNAAGGTVAWQMDRRWSELLGLDPTSIARVFGALGNPQRVRVAQSLLAGPMSTADLTARLDEPSSGQLFHHLKELLGAGIIYQPQRGTYAIRQHHIVPLLTVVSCALDVASSTSPE